MKQVRNAKWYEVKIQYMKAQEDGTEKKVTETYCFDALTFTEAESAAVENLSSIVDDITGISIAKYKEVFLDDEAEKFYKVTVKLLTIDEKSGKEKQTPVTYLVQADSTALAEKRTKDVMDAGMTDWKISDINESKVLEVFVHDDKKQ